MERVFVMLKYIYIYVVLIIRNTRTVLILYDESITMLKVALKAAATHMHGCIIEYMRLQTDTIKSNTVRNQIYAVIAGIKVEKLKEME